MLEHNPRQVCFDYELFSTSRGFNDHLNEALILLESFINLLNRHAIGYMLICGTLLGKVRNDGFLPWDDDIDLLISTEDLNFISSLDLNDHHLLEHYNFKKFCHKSRLVSVKDEHITALNPDKAYNWPYIDLFPYKTFSDDLYFFERYWSVAKMLPVKKMRFYHLEVSVPYDPDYFLSINYGHNYKVKCVSSNWNHKLEQHIPMIQIADIGDIT